MQIEFVEIQNFRKLKSIRIDFSKDTTVFVGANNSGKTSAMGALRHFLVDQGRFTTNDLTLSNWTEINKFGAQIEKAETDKTIQAPALSDWETVFPSMDVWLQVERSEIHYISHLLPTLDWEGGPLGVRLRFEPKDIEELYKEYTLARKAARETVDAAKTAREDGKSYSLTLWPSDMCDFLEKRLLTHFTVRAYSLDPAKCQSPDKGVARPQPLPKGTESIDGDPLKGLIRVRMIDAQRGFADADPKPRSGSDSENDGESAGKGKLSSQLQVYYKRHIDPAEMPEPKDVDALEAIYQAQEQFNKKLKAGFKSPFEELEDLGYPGVANPKLSILTKLRPTDGLNHASALQYEVISEWEENSGKTPCLPEQYNGLGYQNLISIVFRLMSFRDEWMRVGKAAKRTAESPEDRTQAPLLLVLVEEPEAHLHAQVQQVFIRRAYKILRNHSDLKESKLLSTQFIVSTHSSHVAHECHFACLRYFRRRPATMRGEVPTSTVVNLSEVFGAGMSTERFVTRYLKATHCDLFFADGAILVEGPAERMLVPHFIRKHYNDLSECYITLLEINGRHAHRLRPLIEHLGINTLVITDMDVSVIEGAKKTLRSAHPERNKGLVTGNFSLRNWAPKERKFDDLLDMPDDRKVVSIDEFSSVRVAYQTPIVIKGDGSANDTEALVNTFEDALVLTNVEFFKELKRPGLIKKFRAAIAAAGTADDLVKGINAALETGDKAELALELLLLRGSKPLTVPKYISEGLAWLEQQLKKKQLELIISEQAAKARIKQAAA